MADAILSTLSPEPKAFKSTLFFCQAIVHTFESFKKDFRTLLARVIWHALSLNSKIFYAAEDWAKFLCSDPRLAFRKISSWNRARRWMMKLPPGSRLFKITLKLKKCNEFNHVSYRLVTLSSKTFWIDIVYMTKYFWDDIFRRRFVLILYMVSRVSSTKTKSGTIWHPFRVTDQIR